MDTLETPASSPRVDAPSTTKIAVAAAVALIVAAILLITIILPAEYGLDPFGTGATLGILNLSSAEPGAASAPAAAGTMGLVHQPAAYRSDTLDFRLAPNEWVEYKFRLAQGRALLYSWTSTDPIVYDMHSEQDGAPPESAQRFESDEKQQDFGTYTAPFSGIHGWYFQNQFDRPLAVQLKVAGFYTEIHEFHEGTHLIREMK
jgi:hypothetical protein